MSNSTQSENSDSHATQVLSQAATAVLTIAGHEVAQKAGIQPEPNFDPNAVAFASAAWQAAAMITQAGLAIAAAEAQKIEDYRVASKNARICLRKLDQLLKSDWIIQTDKLATFTLPGILREIEALQQRQKEIHEDNYAWIERRCRRIKTKLESNSVKKSGVVKESNEKSSREVTKELEGARSLRKDCDERSKARRLLLDVENWLVVFLSPVPLLGYECFSRVFDFGDSWIHAAARGLLATIPPCFAGLRCKCKMTEFAEMSLEFQKVCKKLERLQGFIITMIACYNKAAAWMETVEERVGSIEGALRSDLPSSERRATVSEAINDIDAEYVEAFRENIRIIQKSVNGVCKELLSP